ncbi:hypothetical protein OS175_05180 [Marinicella sp. S1101]|nr:hypothetical protein [Marinicella marina]MDJ1138993.1 hypothetical protein [Marinicella marina]
MTHLLLGMNKVKSNPTQAYLINLAQPVFRSMRKEGKRDTHPWQSVGELSESEIGSLNSRARPVFGGTTKEGKRDTHPWQSVGEQSESEIGSLNSRARPVFGGTTKEGKRDTYDV